MNIESLVADMFRSGVFALVGSRVIKAIGEKEIAQIISYCGWCSIGADTVMIADLISTRVQTSVKGILGLFDKLDKFTGGLVQPGSLLDKIINFGGIK